MSEVSRIPESTVSVVAVSLVLVNLGMLNVTVVIPTLLTPYMPAPKPPLLLARSEEHQIVARRAPTIVT